METQEGKQSLFIDRDISWLYFNERVLEEAAKESTPLLERLKFLAIYSSNLDEFYLVRMPLLLGQRKLDKKNRQLVDNPNTSNHFKSVKRIIRKQQKRFGSILVQNIIPSLGEEGIILNYGKELPDFAIQELRTYFYVEIASYLHIMDLKGSISFFPENNHIYFFILSSDDRRFIINIPSNHISRFKVITHDGRRYVFFIDDIIKHFIGGLGDFNAIKYISSFKVTRNAELNIKEEAGTDLSEELMKELQKRDFGLATRLLYTADLPKEELNNALDFLQLKKSNAMAGGQYHNLKDFFAFPITEEKLRYSPHAQILIKELNEASVVELMEKKDILLHTPYHSYDTVVRFFNEAALDSDVTHIYTTVYRLAKDSKIGHALLNAARNGKKVFVFVELKARFDEDNNIQWAKRLAKEGVQISYGIPKIKVHAKIALVIRSNRYYGLLSTGNLNENTAKQYTDHSLLTVDQEILQELHSLFSFLSLNRRKNAEDKIDFKQLLVAHFNLYDYFIKLIDFEISEAQHGRKALIRIKLNNLEEESLINKLYQASQSGVKVELIVLGICRLVAGKEGLSENIRVKRIVGRYLEHSRIFNFFHSGDNLLYLGSSDWMHRNIFHRVEVCFPISNKDHKEEILHYLEIQNNDDLSATWILSDGQNGKIESGAGISSQEAILHYLQNKQVG
ncbi:polyphosphate kinase 1 [Sphingobacterium hotanense]|uniref:Polyphosphate kinase n=1 Tax=Sphingobacterium hotanense TaxID=649196 RepID=A0ABT7NKA6_9SPHI|nr:polyphosphate kinase 1 [Sphingobacterium hotanense]MDM1047659.1 polyphosphate kinase 1 [Sphingobacterium hotanense]